MIKNIIVMLASFLITNGLYADTTSQQASNAKIGVEISDFELISDGSSGDCNKNFEESLKQKTWVIHKGAPKKLPSNQLIQFGTHIAKDYSGYRQVLGKHKMIFADGETADMIVGFAQSKSNGDAATGLMILTNWSNDKGSAEKKVCLFSFKEKTIEP